MAVSIPEEVEAKLLVPRAADLRAIARLTEVGTYRLRSQRPQRLHTRYFDTRDLALARHGIALRLRRCGRRWELTAKWEGSIEGVLHRRPEYTIALRRAPETPFRLTDPHLHTELAAILAGRPLGVVLVSDIARQTMLLLAGDGTDRDDDAPSAGSTLAELALDRVHLHGEGGTAGRHERYCELEIEQRSGSTDDIEAVVTSLRERFSLQPSTETKFSRGLALTLGFRRTAPVDRSLSPDDDVATAARKIIASQLTEVRRHDPGTRRGEDPEALHDMRVAVRRLRAARKTLESGIPPSLHAFLGSELRWLGDVLGKVRDLDVQIARAAKFCTMAPPSLRKSFAEFVHDLEVERTAQRRLLMQALDSRRYNTLLVRLERFTAARPRRRTVGAGGLPAAGLAADALASAYRKLLKQGRKVHADPLPEELHALRIRAKRVRYVLEFFRGVAGKAACRAARRLARLQDLLGDYNDSMVTAAFVQRFVDGAGADAPPSTQIAMGAVIGSELARGERLRQKFGERWKRFTSEQGRRTMEETVERLGAQAVDAIARRNGTARDGERA